ncbi:PREDICTED: uncharacterized protein LOC109153833 [Ipomoea nil]|uniref:uncharacterized protein LOC109153833 n=1 Tax=Ipomoea nil TaxID=35883 RepID=UPI000901B1EA|nr:PREDICTED: uncharacterized protein LOC109153833 [Ipomoea nil]
MECIPSELRGSEYMHFKYAFWAFKPAIDRFRSCVPVICIDGTHLYNRYKGHLLLACGYTANKEIYPLAYSIVDSKNNASWTWFIRLLVEHVFPDYDSMCIVSDRHAGIDVAFKNVRQLHGRVKRRYCLRHLRSNVLTKVSRNRWLRRLIWEAGTAVTTNQFNENMQTIQQNWPNAYNYLAELDEETWRLCHDGGHRYDIMTTNLSGSFNNSIKSCRILPVTAIARITFHKLRTMFADRRTVGEMMHQQQMFFTPKIYEDLVAKENESKNASIERYNDTLGIYSIALISGYMAHSLHHHFHANLAERTCNCGKWNVDGIPCAHVIAACNFRREAFYQFIPQVYSV